jgi:hypothetical protein
MPGATLQSIWPASPPAGTIPGARWRLDGKDLQANLVRLDQGDRIQPHPNDEVDVLVVVVSGRGELTLDGQVHPLAPMVIAHLPKGDGQSDRARRQAARLPVDPPSPTAGTADGSARPGTLRPKGQATREGSWLAQSARWSFGHDARSFMTP